MSYPCGSVRSVTILHEDAILRLCIIAARLLNKTVSECLIYCNSNSNSNSDNVATLALLCLGVVYDRE